MSERADDPGTSWHPLRSKVGMWFGKNLVDLSDNEVAEHMLRHPDAVEREGAMERDIPPEPT